MIVVVKYDVGDGCTDGGDLEADMVMALHYRRLDELEFVPVVESACCAGAFDSRVESDAAVVVDPAPKVDFASTK